MGPILIEAFRYNRWANLHMLMQGLHHGNDHRTHICTILGQHGIERGDMDVWAYGHATGALAPVQSMA